MIHDMAPTVLAGLFAAAFGAGLIDAMVGGGGLIQIPALFGFLPGIGHASLLGTNKISSVVGTTFAAQRYARVIQIPWNAVWPATLMALVGAFIGAYIVTQISTETLRLLLPVLLSAVALYTFLRKDLGSVHAPKLSRSQERFFWCLRGLGHRFVRRLLWARNRVLFNGCVCCVLRLRFFGGHGWRQGRKRGLQFGVACVVCAVWPRDCLVGVQHGFFQPVGRAGGCCHCNQARGWFCQTNFAGCGVGLDR